MGLNRQIVCFVTFLVLAYGRVDRRPPTREIPKLLVLSFDGFRPDYINSTATPNLLRLAKSGVWAKQMKATYVTKTFPNHFSIATGYYQETHGIVNNVMFDPVLNETFDVPTVDSKWWDNGLSIPMWVANQMSPEPRFSGSMMWPGSNAEIHGMSPRYLQPYNRNISWVDRVETIIKWMKDPKEPANCVFAYFDQPDDTAHYYGPFSTEVRKQIRQVDSIAGYLRNRLRQERLLRKTNLIVLSDHGMAEVTGEREINLTKLTDISLYSIYGSSPVYNVLPKEGKEEEVYQMLNNLSQTQKFTVYKREDIPEEYHYKNNRRVLNMIVEADESWDIFDKSWDKPAKVWGNHGYNNTLLSMRPMFMAKGPAFRKHHVHADTFENIDLYPLMAHILKLNPTSFPSNGTLSHIQDMLK